MYTLYSLVTMNSRGFLTRPFTISIERGYPTPRYVSEIAVLIYIFLKFRVKKRQ